MKRIGLLGQAQGMSFESFNGSATILADEQIIELHKILLTDGFHYIQVANVKEGRSTLGALLDSLAYYCDVGCLTLETMPLPSNIFDLYYHLSQEGYLDSGKYSADLEKFFLERFENDFLWIEATPELIKKPWYLYFEQKLLEFRIHEKIPIIVVSYKR